MFSLDIAINENEITPQSTTNVRVFTMTKDVATVVTSTTSPILVNNQYANVLFDMGATHSFVSSTFAKR